MTVEQIPPPADGVEVLALSGELDIASVPALADRIEALGRQAVRLVLDLTEVEFFDSAGVRLVDRLARDCARRGGCLRLVAPPGNRARRVLELVGLSDPLVCDDRAAAVAAVREG